MLMEFAPGRDLFDEINHAHNYRLSPDQARIYAAHIIAGLGYLHEESVAPGCIIHRDLKPENILIDARSNVARIADFGFARQISSRGQCYSFVGTPEYMAPEMVAGREVKKEMRSNISYRFGHGKAVDWWALGILLYEMLTGRTPFYSPNGNGEMWRQIQTGIYRYPRDFAFDQFADPYREVKGLIAALLETDPSERLGSQAGGSRDVQEHPWFASIDFGAKPPMYRPSHGGRQAP